MPWNLKVDKFLFSKTHKESGHMTPYRLVHHTLAAIIVPGLTPGVDFIKQFTPYAWNLRSAPNFFPWFSIMYLRLTPNLFHFLLDLGALYALRRGPNFYEIHPWSLQCKR